MRSFLVIQLYRMAFSLYYKRVLSYSCSRYVRLYVRGDLITSRLASVSSFRRNLSSRHSCHVYLAPPSGSLVGLGLLLQLDDRRAKLVGGGMADRVPLALLVLLPRPLVARQDLTHAFHTFCLQTSDLFAENFFEFLLPIYKDPNTSW